MKKSSTLFLKVVLILIAIIALVGLIWFPQTEGRAANLDLISIYTDPLILFSYIAATPFFVALYQAIKLLGYVDTNRIFSTAAINAVRNIKYCSLALSGFILAAILYIRVMAQGDDAAGPTMLGLVVTFSTVVVAVAAGVFQKILQNAVSIKSENDLTV